MVVKVKRSPDSEDIFSKDWEYIEARRLRQIPKSYDIDYDSNGVFFNKLDYSFDEEQKKLMCLYMDDGNRLYLYYTEAYLIGAGGKTLDKL